MRRVVIESPYQGLDDAETERNIAYAQGALLDCLKRGESPFASHLLYTQVLNNKKRSQRELGIRAGYEWACDADLLAVYVDLGISKRMKMAVARAKKLNIQIEYRKLKNWVYKPV